MFYFIIHFCRKQILLHLGQALCFYFDRGKKWSRQPRLEPEQGHLWYAGQPLCYISGCPSAGLVVQFIQIFVLLLELSILKQPLTVNEPAQPEDARMLQLRTEMRYEHVKRTHWWSAPYNTIHYRVHPVLLRAATATGKHISL